jgi:hypothetical protein
VVEATVIETVELPEPGAAMEVGLKPTVTPVGWPVAVSATAALKPPETVVEAVADPELPCWIVEELGETEIAKSGLALLSRISAVQISSDAPLRRSVQDGKKVPLNPSRLM